MTTKDLVLKALEAKRGEFVSGEELANIANISRTAVWKAACSLAKEGMPIEAVRNRGYRLPIGADALSIHGIEKYLIKGFFDLQMYQKVTSTNIVAKEAAAKGAREGVVVIAHEQTGGRGRFDRKFFSPKGCGAYFSVIFRPKMSFEQASLLTVMAAVAVAEGIESIGGLPTSIKWVNDVYVEGKKCCGILTEAVSDMESGKIDYAVVGIGVNVKTPNGGYGELQNVACAACDGVDDALNKIIAATLNRLAAMYTDFDRDDIAKRYKAKSFIIGKDICVINGDSQRAARAVGIDDDCRLIVRYEDGNYRRRGGNHKVVNATKMRSTSRLVLIAVFVGLIIVGAFIKFPIGIVPVSMQCAICILCMLLLGPRDSLIAVLLYIIMGLIGIPVFTAGGGIGYVLQPTFGYLLGYVIALPVGGVIASGFKNDARPAFFRMLLGALIALAIVYTTGVMYMYLLLKFYVRSPIAIGKAWLTGCAVFLPTDIMWCVVGSIVARRVAPRLKMVNIASKGIGKKLMQLEYVPRK